MPVEATSPWLTLEQLCERLQVPVSTARAWRVQRNGPPAVKVGRFLRYRLEDVKRWEASLTDRRNA